MSTSDWDAQPDVVPMRPSALTGGGSAFERFDEDDSGSSSASSSGVGAFADALSSDWGGGGGSGSGHRMAGGAPTVGWNDFGYSEQADPRSLARRVLLMFLSVYLSFFGWHTVYAFVQAVYWQFLKPGTLGVSAGGVASMVFGLLLAPLLLELPRLPVLLTRHVHKLAPVWVLCSALLVAPVHEIWDLALLTIAMIVMLLYVGALLCRPPNDATKQRAPYAAVLGLLLLFAVRTYLQSSPVLLMNRGALIGISVFAMLFSIVLVVMEERLIDPRFTDVVPLHRASACAWCCCGTWKLRSSREKTSFFVFPLTGAALGATVFFALWFATWPGTAARWAAHEPMNSGAYTFIGFALGWLLPSLLSFKIGSEPVRMFAVSLAAALLLVVGGGFLAHSTSSATAKIAGAAAAFAGLPTVLILLVADCGLHGRALSVGRTLACAGITLMLLFAASLSYVVGGRVAVGTSLHLRSEAMLWVVLGVMLCAFAVLMLVRSVIAQRSEEERWRCIAFTHAAKEASMLLLFVGIVFAIGSLLQFVVYRGNDVSTPGGADALVVTTYNTQQAFGLDGKPNLERVRDRLRALGSNLVVLQESDSMHPFSGTVDQLDYLHRQLNMNYYLGLPNYDVSMGTSMLSSYALDNCFFTELVTPTTDCDDCPLMRRAMSECDVTIQFNTVVHVANVHIEAFDFTTASAQVNQVVDHLLATVSSTTPLLLLGDFNLDPTTTDGQLALNRVVAPTPAGGLAMREARVYQSGDVTTSTGHYIDLIYFRGLTLMAPASIDNTGDDGPSDHFPVTAEFRPL